MTVSTATEPARYDLPGPGSWQINVVHQPRPAPLFHRELYPQNYRRGFRESTRRYGLLLDCNDCAYVDGFWYMTPRLVEPAEVPERLATVATVFERRLWREDVERWDGEVKPAAMAANRALQAVDPSTLDAAGLAAHLDRCRRHLAEMMYQHMRFTVPAALPVGDLLVQAGEWTGLPAAELLGMMRGASPVSAGASAELDRLVAALRADGAARALLAAHDGEDALAALAAQPGEVAAALAAWLDLVGYRLLDGLDVGEPYALEMPGVLVDAIRAASEAGGASDPSAAAAGTAARVRDQVPQGHRAAFDGLLAEARHVYRLREERGVFTDVWACGVTRRVILAAGRRLAGEGRIEEPEHLVEAAHEEMTRLILGQGGPSAPELGARARRRATARAVEAPPSLGPEPPTAPPPGGLPAEALRAVRAMQTYVGALFGGSQAANEARLIRGLAASPGSYTGRACVVPDAAHLGRLRQGDVLVTASTSEAFNIALPLAGAIVTDWGGLLSHAAIVSREFGIPGVVGTREATALIPDGARVRVDGAAGEVTVLG